MEIELHRTFIKQFKKLPREIRNKFIERKNIFRLEPFHPLIHNHELSGEWIGHRSINITGDYRALFREEKGIIIFVSIGTHSELYD